MNRELVLLTPFRLPTQHTLMLNADDVAVFLNGYLTLWHPAALANAASVPKIASPYDHETPLADHVYAVPEQPPLFLPDDWEQRVAQAGAAFFKVTRAREETVANLATAIGGEHGEPSRNHAFFGIGFGYVMLEALFEAMDHSPQLDDAEFWRIVQEAVKANNDETMRQHLRDAAQKLKDAREIVYPNNIYFVDLHLLDDVPEGSPLPVALELETTFNAVASGTCLERLTESFPDAANTLRQAVQAERLDIATGPLFDRDDALMPHESQLWNLRKGFETYKRIIGQEARVYGRKRFAASPYLPQTLTGFGIDKAVLLPFDDGVLPQFKGAVTEWISPDGDRINAFTRKPMSADDSLTWFHFAHHLSKTILHDFTASLCFLHGAKPSAACYRDWLELNRLGLVFGQSVTLTQFFTEVAVNEYPAPPTADDFHSNYLDELVTNHAAQPVSRFAKFARQRRRLESLWTLAAMHRGLSKNADVRTVAADLQQRENELETAGATEADFSGVAAPLVERLLAKAIGGNPGTMLLNPCGFSRRVGVELSKVKTPLPAPARATQIEDDKARVVVELPPFGFAWLPDRVTPGTKVAMPKLKLAENLTVRNDYFEAEVDPQTGGLRVIRDTRYKIGHLGQQLVFIPGSVMKPKEIKVTSSGPALGEIVSEGALLDAHDNLLATYRQRLRAWFNRPLLELHIELFPNEPPHGYAWHACYGARFAWRDPRASMFRAVNLITNPTTHTRPESPDFIEVRSGPHRTAMLIGGLPFHQRFQQRMLDIMLVPEGESTHSFELALGLNLDDPIQAAQDFVTPPIIQTAPNGPPHVGTSAWLFHIDSSNIITTSLRPAPDGADAIVARLIESRGIATEAMLRCPRNPTRAMMIDENDIPVSDLTVTGDAVTIGFSACDMVRVRVEFN